MNKSYRSIWNPSLGCYVAAPECATAHPAATSSSRAVRCGQPMRSKAALVLEPRILFDGAMLVTAIEADGTDDGAAQVVEEAEAEPAAAEPVAVAAASEETTEPAADADDAATEGTAADATAPGDAETTSEGDTGTEPVAATPTDSDADTAADIATEPEAPSRTEVVFVDSRVNDPSVFGTDGREVVIIAADQDGLGQIASALDGRAGVDAIHIVSHGGDGYLSLGSGSITADSLRSADPATLQLIGQALTEDGDILIYACDYAAGDAGLEAMQLIADLTGADVAASSDATGHESLGGDWTLEQSTGAIETAELAPLAWMNALDFTFTGAGTVGALGMANNIMGAGVTVVSATYQGGATQSGTFTAGSGVTFGSDVLGFTSGTLLSTGENAAGVAGPNSSGGFGSDALSGVDGDATLDAMAGYPTFDAAILNINFIPDVPPGGAVGDVGRMTLEIVFGSDEYLEYIGSINDVMEVTVNGQVVSLVPNSTGGQSTIGINSVNNTENPALFIDNTAGTYNTQMDAFTITIPLVFDVIVGQTNTLRLAVADAVDNAYDSWLFIRADSGQTVVVAEDDQVVTAANLPITVDLTANDYSLAGGSMTLTHIQGQTVTQGQVITLASGVQLTVGAGGQVIVTGDGSNAANDTFTYQVSNGMGGIASATVNVEVTAPNFNPPTAQDDVESVLADGTLSDSVLTNNGNGADSDPNGDPLSVVQVNLTSYTPGDPISLPSGALLTMNANGSYVYDPNGAFDGLAGGATTTDSFSYTVTDGQGGNNTATVTVTITGVNDAPAALDDSYVASEDDASYLGAVIANDTDVDGFITGVDYFRGGVLDPADYPVLVSSQVLANWTSNDYDGVAGGLDGRNVDGNVVQGVSSLTAGSGITLTGNATRQSVDVAGLDSATLAEARTNGDYIDVSFTTLYSVIDLSAMAFGVLDVNGEGSGYTVTVELLPDGDLARALTLTASHTLPGPPAPGSYVWDQVAVDASHLLNPLSNYTVRIYLYGNPGDSTAEFNDLHLFYNDRGTMDIGELGAGDLGGFFTFDDSGGVVFIPNGDFDDLAAGESRDTHWVYAVQDDQGATSTATVTVTVQGVNDAPLTADDAFDVSEDGAWVLSGVLDNDTDPEGDALYISLAGLTGSNGGSFTMDDGGNLIFIPGTDFDDLNVGQSRQTVFTYHVNDDFGAQTAATVAVTVHGANDAPVGGADHFLASEDVAIWLGDVTQNDWDIEGGLVVADTSVFGPGAQGGFFVFDDGGSLIFNPGSDFQDLGEGESRDTWFEYTLYDDQGAAAVAVVTVTVLGANDAPVAQDDGFVAFEDIPVTLGSVTGNDSDVDGDDLFLQLVGSAPGSHGGRFTVDGGGNLVFDPEGDFEALEAGETLDTSFVYQTYDGQGGVGEATVTVTVTGANDAPVAADDHYDAFADVFTSLGSPLDNDTDIEGHALALEQTLWSAGSQGGFFSVDESGQLWFDPAGEFDDLPEGETRDTTFNYTVTDSQGGASTGTVTVTVHGASNPPEIVIDFDDALGASMGEPLSTANQIVFVDARVPDPTAFATDGRELVIINTETDGIVQIANALAGRSGIEAVHIISHGAEGVMTLGLGDIQTTNLDPTQIQALQALATALTDNADILVYACEFAGGQAGIDGMQALAQYTQADVAASLFVTGDPALGGNWSLEATVGSIETSSIAPPDWGYLLDDPQVGPLAPPERVVGTPVAKPVPVVVQADEPNTRSGQPMENRLALGVTAEPVDQPAPTVRVMALETALRDGITGAAAWKAGRVDAWNVAPLWLEEFVIGGTTEGDASDEPLAASAGFQAQLQRFAQWGVGRPLVRAAVRG